MFRIDLYLLELLSYRRYLFINYDFINNSMSLDIPEMVPAYKCKRCGILYENKGDNDRRGRQEFLEHCRQPVVELPVGFVLRRLDRNTATGFYIIGNPKRITTDHQTVYDCFIYSQDGSCVGNTPGYPHAILRDVRQGNYRFLTGLDMVKFDRISNGLGEKLQLPNGLITNPPGFVIELARPVA